MSSAHRLQEYLSFYDVGLFPLLKLLRRNLEDVETIDWCISGDLALILYGYMTQSERVEFPSLTITIRLNTHSFDFTKQTVAFFNALQEKGFAIISEEKPIDSVISLSHDIFPRFKIDFIYEDDVAYFTKRHWIQNRMGKLLYPICDIKLLISSTQNKISFYQKIVPKEDQLKHERLSEFNDEYNWLLHLSNEIELE